MVEVRQVGKTVLAAGCGDKRGAILAFVLLATA